MLQAMNVGHDGSLTTVHASSPGDVIHRLEWMALMGAANVSRDVVRGMIASALDLIVYVTRFRDGRRVVTSIHEVRRGKDDIVVRELFRFEPRRRCTNGPTVGRHVAVQSPMFMQELAAAGYPVPEHLLPAVKEGAGQ